MSPAKKPEPVQDPELANKLTAMKAYADMIHSMKPVLKADKNGHFKSKYAGLPDIARAANEAAFAFDFCTEEYTLPANEEESRWNFYVRLTHTPTGWEKVYKVPLNVEKAGPQGWRAALTYARRTGLELAFRIAPEDDDGNAAQKAHDDAQKRDALDTSAGRLIARIDQMEGEEALDGLMDHSATKNLINGLCEVGSAGLVREILNTEKAKRNAFRESDAPNDRGDVPNGN